LIIPAFLLYRLLQRKRQTLNVLSFISQSFLGATATSVSSAIAISLREPVPSPPLTFQ